MSDAEDKKSSIIVEERPKKVPRLYHKKSKKGCLRCRERRVKCDEQKPTCGGCGRHQVVCNYPEVAIKTESQSSTQDSRNNHDSPATRYHSPAASSSSAGGPLASTPASLSATIHHPPAVLKKAFSWTLDGIRLSEYFVSVDNMRPHGLPDGPMMPLDNECAERRLAEIRLVHHFTTSTALTLPGMHDPAVFRVWTKEAPVMALQSPALLSGLLAITALHMSRTMSALTRFKQVEYRTAYQAYLGDCLHHHQKDISQLSIDNADSVCLTTTMLRVQAFAALSDRSFTPYTLPLDWLRMTRSSGFVFRTAWTWIKDEDSSAAFTVAKASPLLTDFSNLYNTSNLEPFQQVLTFVPKESTSSTSNPAEWTAETRDAFERTLALIGSCKLAKDAGESAPETGRRILGFIMMVPRLWLELIEMGDPRALVILGYYFAMADGLEGIWWIGLTARNEVVGIMNMLPEEWRHLLAWAVGRVD